MKTIFSVLIALLLFTACDKEAILDTPTDTTIRDDPNGNPTFDTISNAWMLNINEVNGVTTFYSGNTYSITATMDFSAGAIWSPRNMQMWLAEKPKCSVDQTAVGTHIWSGWFMPATAVTYIAARRWQGGPPTLTDWDELWIKPSRWKWNPTNGENKYGYYYLVGVADGEMLLTESDELIDNIAWKEVLVLGPPDEGKSIEEMMIMYDIPSTPPERIQ